MRNGDWSFGRKWGCSPLEALRPGTCESLRQVPWQWHESASCERSAQLSRPAVTATTTDQSSPHTGLPRRPWTLFGHSTPQTRLQHTVSSRVRGGYARGRQTETGASLCTPAGGTFPVAPWVIMSPVSEVRNGKKSSTWARMYSPATLRSCRASLPWERSRSQRRQGEPCP